MKQDAIADLNDAARKLLQANAGLLATVTERDAMLAERDATIADLQKILDATRAEMSQWKALAKMHQ